MRHVAGHVLALCRSATACDPAAGAASERLGELETKLQTLIRGQEAASSPPIVGVSQQEVGARDATGITGPGGHFKQTLDIDTPEEIMSGLKWWENKTVPAAVHDYLLKIFITHCWRVHFYFNQTAFETRMASNDPATRPHPCYLNGIYLMACYFTSLDLAPSPYLGEHEGLFLGRAQKALTESLAMSDRLMDFVRGSSLVTIYFLMRGRYLEGYHVHCGTARFALSCGLHRINSNELSEIGDDHSASNIGYLLSPPETEVELGDRLNAFWQIYWCDKLLSTLMGFVAALPGQAEQPDGVSSVFPRDIGYYMGNHRSSRSDTIPDLLMARSTPNVTTQQHKDSSFAMVLKALTLLEQANRLGHIHRSKPSDSNIASLKELHMATDRFAATIPVVSAPAEDAEESSASDPVSIAVLMARTITLGALLEMNNTTAARDAQAYNARLTSAGYIASLVFYFGPENYGNADLATGYCWCLAAQVLLEHMHKVRAQLLGPTDPRSSTSMEVSEQSSMEALTDSLTECESQLTRLLAALEKLSTVFPTLGEHIPRTVNTRTIY
ncbi:hypothetical protein FRC04_005887 [Tulasnella sp. 424]|nr:hypothetical protein FRC04_005887 [Tulasnella sp. 424]